LLHHWLEADLLVFFSVDLEHGGDLDGIVQLSAQASVLGGAALGGFNTCVKPPDGTCIQSSSTAVHSLALNDPQSQNAEPIARVWPQFVQFVEQYLAINQSFHVYHKEWH